MNLSMIMKMMRVLKLTKCKNEYQKYPKISEIRNKFQDRKLKSTLWYRKDDYHLPVPVLSYKKRTTAIKCILNILLPQGHFETEIDLITCVYIRECLRYVNQIGPALGTC